MPFIENIYKKRDPLHDRRHIKMKAQNQHIKIDPTQTWLDNVAYANSGSEKTDYEYRLHFKRFLEFLGTTAEDIIEEYKRSSDRDFRRAYGQYLKAWIGRLTRKGYTTGTVNIMIGAVKSFFKYSDLPLSFVPTAKKEVVYHNRDITKEEISCILVSASIRDRAFYAVMAQSGLRPVTLCQLRIKHLEPDFSDGRVPCKIEVPKEIAKGKYAGYFTFIAEEGVKYLRDYLKTRPNLTEDSYVFLGRSGSYTVPRAFSVQFNKLIRKLRDKKVLDFKQKKAGKPAELRLYSLRKFFKKHTYQAGQEFNEFWMGHKGQGVTDNYRTRDPEFHRNLYEEKAMPFLRIGTASPTETEKTIKELRGRLETRDGEIQTLKQEMRTMQDSVGELVKIVRELKKEA